MGAILPSPKENQIGSLLDFLSFDFYAKLPVVDLTALYGLKTRRDYMDFIRYDKILHVVYPKPGDSSGKQSLWRAETADGRPVLLAKIVHRHVLTSPFSDACTTDDDIEMCPWSEPYLAVFHQRYRKNKWLWVAAQPGSMPSRTMNAMHYIFSSHIKNNKDKEAIAAMLEGKKLLDRTARVVRDRYYRFQVRLE